MANNETIADIIADMRGGPIPQHRHDRVLLCHYADRFEAAHKRESGDFAKLREAVAELIDVMYELGIDENTIVIAAESKHCHMNSNSHLSAIKKAKAALAAPARNCDIAQDWLRDLYVNFKPPASVKREMSPEWVDAVMAFCRWLVAPATEKEGGNKNGI